MEYSLLNCTEAFTCIMFGYSRETLLKEVGKGR